MHGKFLSLVLAMCLLGVCIGCGNGSDDSAPPDKSAASQPAPSPQEKALDAMLSAQVRLAALMKQVKDADSARALLPLLKKAVAEANKASDELGKLPDLPPEEDKMLTEKFSVRQQAAQKALKEQTTRLKAMPEIHRIILPAFE